VHFQVKGWKPPRRVEREAGGTEQIRGPIGEYLCDCAKWLICLEKLSAAFD